MLQNLKSGSINTSKNNVLDLTSFETYQATMAIAITRELVKLGVPLNNLTLDMIKQENAKVLAYEGIDNVELDFSADKITVFDPANIDTTKAVKDVLAGKVFWEHTAAGEATRLALGTKYILNNDILAKAFATHPNFTTALSDEDAKKNKTLTQVQLAEAKELLKTVLNINFGIRHLISLAVTVQDLAKKAELDPQTIIKRQASFTILNEATADQITSEIIKYNFLGFDRSKMFFMVQRSGNGYTMQNGKVTLNETTEKKLYNHGAMKQQAVMDNQVFYFNEANERVYISYAKYRAILTSKSLLLSANIEDLDYLKNAIDLPNVAIGLEMGERGHEMVMTAVKQKDPPQKGGYFGLLNGTVGCYETDGDPKLFSAKAEDLAKIKYLNKNFNMFPHPVQAYDKMKQTELPIHLTVKGDAMYPQTPQGDISFIANTGYIMESQPRAIRNLKEQNDILNTLKEFAAQDTDPRFIAYARQFGVIANSIDTRVDLETRSEAEDKVNDKGGAAQGNI